MCGLTGVALHPSATTESRGKALVLFNAMLLDMERRGSHATGVSVFGQSGRRKKRKYLQKTLKGAIRAAELIKTEPYAEHVAHLLQPEATILLGHTRHATHGSKEKDECAHPFTYGEVTGAHNGIIFNYKELAEKKKLKVPDVDSEIVFSMLANSTNFDPLSELEGYFALTWVQQGVIHFARSVTADLSVAYSPELMMLAWASTDWALRDGFKKIGLMNPVIYKPSTDFVYMMDPLSFGAEQSNPVKVAVPFTSQKRSTFNGANPLQNGHGAQKNRYPTGGNVSRGYGDWYEGSDWEWGGDGRYYGSPYASLPRRDEDRSKPSVGPAWQDLGNGWRRYSTGDYYNAYTGENRNKENPPVLMAPTQTSVPVEKTLPPVVVTPVTSASLPARFAPDDTPIIGSAKPVASMTQPEMARVVEALVLRTSLLTRRIAELEKENAGLMRSRGAILEDAAELFKWKRAVGRELDMIQAWMRDRSHEEDKLPKAPPKNSAQLTLAHEARARNGPTKCTVCHKPFTHDNCPISHPEGWAHYTCLFERKEQVMVIEGGRGTA